MLTRTQTLWGIDLLPFISRFFNVRGQEEGLCVGYARTQSEYFLDHQDNKFKNHIELLSHEGADRVEKKINQVERLSGQELTPEEKGFLDIFIFFKNILTYQRNNMNNLEIKSSTLLANYFILNNADWIKNELTYLEGIFQEMQKECKDEHEQRIALHWSDANHMIALLYSSMGHTWFLCNGTMQIQLGNVFQRIRIIQELLPPVERGFEDLLQIQIYIANTASCLSYLQDQFTQAKEFRKKAMIPYSISNELKEKKGEISHHFASEGDQGGISYIVNNGGYEHTLTSRAETPITLAIQNNHWDIVFYLLYFMPEGLALYPKEVGDIEDNPRLEGHNIIYESDTYPKYYQLFKAFITNPDLAFLTNHFDSIIKKISGLVGIEKQRLISFYHQVKDICDKERKGILFRAIIEEQKEEKKEERKEEKQDKQEEKKEEKKEESTTHKRKGFFSNVNPSPPESGEKSKEKVKQRRYSR